MTEIKEAGIIVVPVPMDADKFGQDLVGDLTYVLPVNDKRWVKLPKDDFHEILGFMTKETISFDVEPYVGILDGAYLDVRTGYYIRSFTKDDSFRSFITKHTGYVWENPIKFPNIHDYNYVGSANTQAAGFSNEDDFEAYGEALRKYNEAQSKVVEKLLILKTK